MANQISEMSDQDQAEFRTWLDSFLKETIVTVEFNRCNGTSRIMQATLQDKFLPEQKNPKSTNRVNDKVCVVWDVEKQSWRSFRYDRLISISFTFE